MEAQFENAHNAHTYLHVWVPICYAQSVLINKISASELRGKFVMKSALLVGGCCLPRGVSRSQTGEGGLKWRAGLEL